MPEMPPGRHISGVPSPPPCLRILIAAITNVQHRPAGVELRGRRAMTDGRGNVDDRAKVELDQIPRSGGRQIIGMALESPASNHCHQTNYWNGIVDQVLVLKLTNTYQVPG